MNTTDDDINRYLHGVEQAAAALPARSRAELAAQLAERITVVLTARPNDLAQILHETGDRPGRDRRYRRAPPRRGEGALRMDPAAARHLAAGIGQRPEHLQPAHLQRRDPQPAQPSCPAADRGRHRSPVPVVVVVPRPEVDGRRLAAAAGHQAAHWMLSVVAAGVRAGTIRWLWLTRTTPDPDRERLRFPRWARMACWSAVCLAVVFEAALWSMSLDLLIHRSGGINAGTLAP
ncbi:hypothetical protein ACFV29_40195 [Streptomyces sp. NPDC059690]|uniref:hypothetical protein n=1 Tax=Streptomyces sp. NPDC059690 TaxID=3346907 RepID=UPI0036D05E66